MIAQPDATVGGPAWCSDLIWTHNPETEKFGLLGSYGDRLVVLGPEAGLRESSDLWMTLSNVLQAGGASSERTELDEPVQYNWRAIFGREALQLPLPA